MVGRMGVVKKGLRQTLLTGPDVRQHRSRKGRERPSLGRGDVSVTVVRLQEADSARTGVAGVEERQEKSVGLAGHVKGFGFYLE